MLMLRVYWVLGVKRIIHLSLRKVRRRWWVNRCCHREEQRKFESSQIKQSFRSSKLGLFLDIAIVIHSATRLYCFQNWIAGVLRSQELWSLSSVNILNFHVTYWVIEYCDFESTDPVYFHHKIVLILILVVIQSFQQEVVNNSHGLC